MSNAAAAYDRFKEQAVRDGRVFTLKEKGDQLVFRVAGYEVIPFWSSRSRVERVQYVHPNLRAFEIHERTLSDFLALLQKLEADGVRLGANWSGKRLTGYDVEARDVRAGLQYWLDKGPSS